MSARKAFSILSAALHIWWTTGPAGSLSRSVWCTAGQMEKQRFSHGEYQQSISAAYLVCDCDVQLRVSASMAHDASDDAGLSSKAQA